MRGVLFVLAVFALLLGCANPKATVIPTDPNKWDTDLKDSIGKLSKDDQSELSAYLVRVKLGEALGGAAMPSGVTIEKALADQQQFESDQKVAAAATATATAQKAAEAAALKAKVDADRAAAQKQIDDALTVTFVSGQYQQMDFNKGVFSEAELVTIALQNKGTKDISAIKGQLQFFNIFGDAISTVKYQSDSTLMASQSRTAVVKLDTIFDGGDKVRDTPPDKLKFTFIPQSIIFTDGSHVELPADKP